MKPKHLITLFLTLLIGLLPFSLCSGIAELTPSSLKAEESDFAVVYQAVGNSPKLATKAALDIATPQISAWVEKAVLEQVAVFAKEAGVPAEFRSALAGAVWDTTRESLDSFVDRVDDSKVQLSTFEGNGYTYQSLKINKNGESYDAMLSVRVSKSGLLSRLHGLIVGQPELYQSLKESKSFQEFDDFQIKKHEEALLKSEQEGDTDRKKVTLINEDQESYRCFVSYSSLQVSKPQPDSLLSKALDRFQDGIALKLRIKAEKLVGDEGLSVDLMGQLQYLAFKALYREVFPDKVKSLVKQYEPVDGSEKSNTEIVLKLPKFDLYHAWYEGILESTELHSALKNSPAFLEFEQEVLEGRKKEKESEADLEALRKEFMQELKDEK